MTAELHHAAVQAVQAVQIAAVEALAGAPGAHRALAHVVARAHAHGLTVPELCDATGLDQPYITRLLQEAHP